MLKSNIGFLKNFSFAFPNILNISDNPSLFLAKAHICLNLSCLVTLLTSLAI